jgi:SagB-type dehydrogenase family enzyme
MDLTSSVAWRYHQATNHSVQSVRTSSHFLDWTNQPRPYKRYAAPLPSLALPSEPASDTFDAALLRDLLQLSAGITKYLTFPGGRMAFRAAACTGALYHIDLYVVCADLPGVPAGVYHFDVERVALTRVREGDFRAVLVDATAGDERVRGAPATIVATSTWWRNAWKYQSRTYRHAFWDSGTILANLLAVAGAHRLPAAVRLGFVDSTVNALIDVDPQREAALELVPLGSGASSLATPPPAPRLDLPIQAYSFREVDYPLIREVHQATTLAGPDEVRAFRQGSAPTQPLVVPDVEAVIRRRGSARRFAQTPIPRGTLEAMLANAALPPDSDWGAPVSRPYVIVNAVDGLDSGAYVYEGGALQPLRVGDYRAIAGHLDLDQELAEDAAVNIYMLADLRAVIGSLGERGYRAAQLDASLTAGKLYLWAYGSGIAATGLTFYDDEVTDFFSPHAEGKSVMFLLAAGNKPG